MVRHANKGGGSNVVAYEIEQSSIKVEFGDGAIYLYTSQSVGEPNLESMKKLANAGQGSNSFIGKSVRKNYAAKLR